MSILTEQYELVVSGNTFFKGYQETVYMIGPGINGVYTGVMISELSYEELVMHGGIGENGGFRFTARVADIPGTSQFTFVCAYPHTAASFAIIGKTAGGSPIANLVAVAKKPGVYGNQIKINLTVPTAASQPLTVLARGRVIDISVATSAASVVTTTPALLVAAIQANDIANALVTVTGLTGFMSTAQSVFLIGGVGMSGQILSYTKTNEVAAIVTVGDPVAKR